MSFLKKISLLSLGMMSGVVSAGELILSCVDQRFTIFVDFEPSDDRCVLDQVTYEDLFSFTDQKIGKNASLGYVANNIGDRFSVELTCFSVDVEGEEVTPINTDADEVVADDVCINGSQDEVRDMLVEERNEAMETFAGLGRERIEACGQVDSQACLDAQARLRPARRVVVSSVLRIADYDRLETCGELGEDSEECLNAQEAVNELTGQIARINHLISIANRLRACEDAGNNSEQCALAQEEEAEQKEARIDLGDSENALDDDLDLIESENAAIVDDNE